MTKHHWQDARFKKALENAPDAQIQPSQITRDAIKKAAYDAMQPQDTQQIQPWWKRCFSFGSRRKVYLPWNAAFATLLVASCIGMLWMLNDPQSISDNELPPSAVMPPAGYATNRSVTAPVAVPSDTVVATLSGTSPRTSTPAPAPAAPFPPPALMPQPELTPAPISADIMPPPSVSETADARIIAQPAPAQARERLQTEQSIQNTAAHNAQNDASTMQRSTYSSQTAQKTAHEQPHTSHSAMEPTARVSTQKKPKIHNRNPSK